ncbi:MAG: class I SAM-dependent methyltransferase [Planctomycetes bacterium]|nr:class I SAM-dependent methyltransferase [Planctomycetota bacterium]
MSDEDRRKWDERYRERGEEIGEPSALVAAQASRFPRRGRALDLAGGAGRHALWLAESGLDVTLADVSEVALAVAARAAAARGHRLRTLQVDLEHAPLPAGPWDLILVVHFLHRPLFEAIPGALTPGGVLVAIHPTRRNLERHDRPPAGHLLDEGELPGLIRGLETLYYEEGWLAEGRHEALLVARRRAAPAPGREAAAEAARRACE